MTIDLQGDECTTAPGGNPETETCDDDEDICFFKMANNKVQKRDCHKKSDGNKYNNLLLIPSVLQ